MAAASATSNALYTIDDPTVDTDLGAQFTAHLRSAPFDFSTATGWSTLRRLVQSVAISGPVTVVVTPSADGQDFTGQAKTASLVTTDGPEQVVEAHAQVPGTRFRVIVDITSHVGRTELGESDQWLISRRTTRGL